MDIVNNTSDDAKVSVSGGGSGMVKGEEEILSLPAGKTISHTPKPPGPWKVNFYVGNHQTRKMVHCATDKVTLSRAGNNGLRVDS
jgi:hypothetical protein